MIDDEKTGFLTGEDTDVLKKTLGNLEACLLVIRGAPSGKRYELKNNSVSIGRDPSSDVVINDKSVSRYHAEVIVEDTRVMLRDNNSTNGTEVNGKRIQGAVELHKEDLIKVGSTIIKYLPKGELEIVYLGMLENAAYTDALTKLHNKGYLMEALEAEFKRSRAMTEDLSLIILDLDFFKKVNDTYGHDAGDLVLKEVAKTLKKQFTQPRAMLGRFGGEEFVGLLPNMKLQETVAFAETVRAAVEQLEINYSDTPLHITVSVGVADASTAENPEQLFKMADKAVYESKNNGRNRVTAFQVQAAG